MKNKTVLFAGSFDLFHEGHLEFLKFLIKKYKKVYICISNNHSKKNQSSFQTRYKYLLKTLNENNLNDIEIIINFGLTIDIAKDLKCDFLVRSYVNEIDYKYELNLKYINQYLNNLIKTKLFYFDKKPNIRSSLIKNKF